MPANRRAFVRTIGGAVTVTTSLSGCLGFGVFGSTSRKTTIKIDENGFKPKNTKVETKSEISWENTGENVHVVASGSGNWDFETKLPPGSVTYKKFIEEGVYTVIDKKNDASKMKVAVGGAKIDDPIE